MKIRLIKHEDALYFHRDDIVELLRGMGGDYLQHVPGHAAAGEFLECILDRHADFILNQAADFIEKDPDDPPPAP